MINECVLSTKLVFDFSWNKALRLSGTSLLPWNVMHCDTCSWEGKIVENLRSVPAPEMSEIKHWTKCFPEIKAVRLGVITCLSDKSLISGMFTTNWKINILHPLPKKTVPNGDQQTIQTQLKISSYFEDPGKDFSLPNQWILKHKMYCPKPNPGSEQTTVHALPW